MSSSNHPPKGRLFSFWSRLVALGVIGRASLATAPKPMTTRQRLDMLPIADAPLTAEVQVRWNDYQIPAIKAQHDDDLFVTLGIVHAHLRLAQMEMLRRVALGRISEVMGPVAAAFDHSLRLLDFPRCAEQSIAEADPDTRRYTQSFISGINHYLENVTTLPYELRALHVKPEKWSERDFFAVQRLISIDMSWDIWSRLLPLRNQLPSDEWKSLWDRLLACGAPASFEEEDTFSKFMKSTARHGSNSWAQSLKQPGEGAVLASDPHLPFGLPSPFILAITKSPSFDCLGLMMPGQPFIAIGRNTNIAWGGTSLHAQSSDLFDVSNEPETNFTSREIQIKVRWSQRLRITGREHRLGPVVSDGAQFKNPTPLALKWLGHSPSQEGKAMLDVARASNWKEFRQAIQHFAISGLNLVYADKNGHTGRLCAAHMPTRPESLPDDIPLSISRSREWDTIVDSEQLPQEYDLESGTIVSANAMPTGQTIPVGFFFAPPYRQSRIQTLLNQTAAPSTHAMALIQQDVHSPWSLRMKGWLLSYLPTELGSSESALASVLDEWDGGYQADAKAPLYFTFLIGNLLHALEQDKTLSAFEVVWGREQHAEEFLTQQFEEVLSKDRVSLLMEDALAKTSEQSKQWTNWGEFHSLLLNHPLSNVPGVGKHVSARKIKGAGNNDTIYKTTNTFSDKKPTTRYGSSARFLTCTASIDDNHALILGGQDGWIGSANYDDQLALWEQGKYIQLPMTWETIEEDFQFLTVFECQSSPD